jgi:hypothetical protein
MKSITAIGAALALTFVASAPANADSPFVGNWKVQNVSSASEPTYVLMQVEEKDGKLTAKALASPLLSNKASIEKFHADAKSMQFEVHAGQAVYRFKVYVPRDNAKSKDPLGSIRLGNQVGLVRLVKTDEVELKAADAQKVPPERKTLTEAQKMDGKERVAALREILTANGDKPVAYLAAQTLLQNLIKDDGKDTELRVLAESWISIGALYGPEVENHTRLAVCQQLNRTGKAAPLAIEFARQAEKKLSQKDDPAQLATVLKVLATSLRSSGKTAEALELLPRIEKIEEPLDALFAKTAVPFATEPFKGREGKSQRVAVVELFTGAYCPPCVAADIAFDAALKTFGPKDVLLLQYHLHIPQSDRLTNDDTQARYKYYQKSIRGVPTTFLNGKTTKALGGGKTQSQNSYKTLRGEVSEALEKDATAKLLLRVERKGEQLDIRAHVAELKEPGDTMKLRFVLLEELVRYPGGNGQRLHHHVVRAMPGGAEGFVLKNAEGKTSATVNLAELQKSLDAYMTTYNKGARPFVDDEYPLKLRHLKVAALIQDDDSKEILQAAQVDVPEKD